jgi:hypothetical protein
VPTHTVLPAQSPLPAQVVLHAVAPQAYGAHEVVVWLQAPFPSQVPDAFVSTPEVHDCAPLHVVPAGQWWQAPP